MDLLKLTSAHVAIQNKCALPDEPVLVVSASAAIVVLHDEGRSPRVGAGTLVKETLPGRLPTIQEVLNVASAPPSSYGSGQPLQRHTLVNPTNHGGGGDRGREGLQGDARKSKYKAKKGGKV